MKKIKAIMHVFYLAFNNLTEESSGAINIMLCLSFIFGAGFFVGIAIFILFWVIATLIYGSSFFICRFRDNLIVSEKKVGRKSIYEMIRYAQNKCPKLKIKNVISSRTHYRYRTKNWSFSKSLIVSFDNGYSVFFTEEEQ